jgi:hypothetical protein
MGELWRQSEEGRSLKFEISDLRYSCSAMYISQQYDNLA